MKIIIRSLLILVAACSSRTSTGYEIVSVTGDPLTTAVAGDAVSLEVVETFSDNSTQVIEPVDVTWTAPTTVTTLDADSTDDSPIPAFGDAPTAIFINNVQRTDRDDDLYGVLFIADAGTTAGGTATVTAGIMGDDLGFATATISIGATPVGDAAHGATLYADSCAVCHGATAAGSPANPDGTFTINNHSYMFPAPGLDTEPGNLASDPDWNAALLAVAARSDMDNGGLVLRFPMPDWIADPEPVTNAQLETQDFADIYAFLMTQ